MLKNVLIFIFIVIATHSVAQENTFYYGNETFMQDDSLKPSSISNLSNNQKRFYTNLSVGSVFGNYYGNNIFTSYTAPEIGYNFTDKFSISAGTIFSYSSAPSFFYGNDENNQAKNQKTMSYYMFMKGSYLINDKLRVHGSAIFDLSPQVSSGRNAFNSFGLDYKIGDNTFISAEVSFSNFDNNNPFMNYHNADLFNNHANKPINNSLFSEPFPSW